MPENLRKQEFEESHKRSIDTLVREFGSENRAHIERVYLGERELLEKEAKIKKYLPIIAYKTTRQILRAEFEKGYAKEKAKEFKHRHF